jgi:hypothetical protein
MLLLARYRTHPVILPFRRLKQVNQDFEAILGYIAKSYLRTKRKIRTVKPQCLYHII